MAAGGVQGLSTRTWPTRDEASARAKTTTTKDHLLRLWDATTQQIDAAWAQIPPGRFEETDKAFGMWEGPVHSLLLYWIDNEIHHRGQGYDTCGRSASSPRRSTSERRVRSSGSVVGVGQDAKPPHRVLSQLSWTQPPAPVAAGRSRPVHARLAAEAEQILRGNDRRIRDGRHHRANEVPVNLSTLEAEIAPRVLAFVRRCRCADRVLWPIALVHQPTVVSLSCVPV